MNVADSNAIVEGEKPGQWVDSSSILQISNHGDGLARHGTQLRPDGEHVEKGLQQEH